MADFKKILVRKAFRHPDSGSFVSNDEAAKLHEERGKMKAAAEKAIQGLAEQNRGTPQGAAEADHPADHYAAVSYHANMAAKHGAAKNDDARKAHTKAAHAHYKAGNTNSKADSEKARQATDEAHKASKGKQTFQQMPVRKRVDLMKPVK